MANREIKFRVPHFKLNDGTFSHFSYWGTVDHLGNASLDGGCFTSPGTSSSNNNGWHQQFTGLTDKEGTPIYEGDKVSGYFGEGFVIYFEQYAAFMVDCKGMLYNVYEIDNKVTGHIYKHGK